MGSHAEIKSVCVCGGGGGTGGPDLDPENSQEAICFLRNTGTYPPREAIGFNCFSREVHSSLCKMR